MTTLPQLDKVRFAGLDLSPNHFGLVTINGLGNVTGIHYSTNTEKGVSRARASAAFPDGVVTATLYKHPTPAQQPDVQFKEVSRIAHITNDVLDAIDRHNPDFLALEGYAWEANGREYQIGEVGGAVKLNLWERRLPFRIHDNIAVKMFSTHQGNAAKEDVMLAVQERWGHEFFLFCNGGKARETEGDLCDAFVLAMMCLYEWKLRNGLMSPAGMDPKELQVFMRVTKSNPVNILGMEWIVQPSAGSAV